LLKGDKELGNPTTQRAPAPTECKYAGAAPRLIAQVHEKVSTVAGTFKTKAADGGTWSLEFGNDITYGTGGKLPFGEQVSSVEADLKKIILVLAKTYDKTGTKAANEFNEFLKKKSTPPIYSDPALDSTVESDDNFIAFSDFTLNAPGGRHYDPARIRLHQALRSNGWDVNKVVELIGLGVLAFNDGNPYPVFNSRDHANGLTIMIDTVAHALIFVSDYSYSSSRGTYDIELVFELYDAFGLDDEDMAKAGYKAKLANRLEENRGFTAWWQLQHQFAYAPLVTKVALTRRFTDIRAI
jgi:hypothetical protein